jgi:hypothetical protein
VLGTVLAARLGFSPAISAWIAGGTVALGMAPVRTWAMRRFTGQRPQLAETEGVEHETG